MWRYAISIAFVFLLLISAGCSSTSTDKESTNDANETSTVNQQENNKEETSTNHDGEYINISSVIELPDFFPGDVPIPKDAIVVSSTDDELGGRRTVTVTYKLDGEDISGLGENYRNYLEGSGFDISGYNDFDHTIKITAFDKDINMFHISLFVENGKITVTLARQIKLEE